MRTTSLITSILLGATSLSVQANEAEKTSDSQDQVTKLDTVKVSADFRELDLQQIPSAITVVGEDDIQNRNASHLESILSLAPNVNFSAGASRGRYFQIRGIGERSQFIDPVNPSVGLIIDGIDMTGLGGAATLFDVEQVEILRGPQGTAFGANALAGAINIKSKQPTKETEGYVEAKIGNYDTLGLGGAISGTISENVQARFAINQFKTDGYMENIHLNRDDTNNIDETVARAQVAWQINDNNDLNISLLKTDIDNGYDAFSLDNNRNTYSNKPGKDTQDGTAIAAIWDARINSSFDLKVNASSNRTSTEYRYDEDWAYGEYTWMDDDPTYTPDPCDTTQGACLADEDGYSSVDQYLREYSRNTIDVRLTSTQEAKLFNNTTDWVIGLYSSSKEEELERNYTYDSQYTSDISTESTAIYTELRSQLSTDNRLIYGFRLENTSFDFTDNNDLRKSNSEVLWGGKVTFESLIDLDHLAYASIARGFKAGSVNREPLIPEADKLYDTEINHTIETGLKSSLLNDALKIRIAAFFTQREDQQVKQSHLYYNDDDTLQTKPKFKDYFANAGKGHNYGIELESIYDLSESSSWELGLGLLKTEFIDYQFTSSDDDDNVITINKDGREQAHAPSYSLSTAIIEKLTNTLSLRIETELKDSFYYSDSHDEKSSAFQIWNASLNYTLNNLEISLHGRNLTDEEYTTKGFYFGNDPRDGYTRKAYTQFGDPRLITLQARYSF